MPEKATLDKARAAKRAGKSASTQAGEFVHEEIRHVREGKHGARSAKQAIAIGLSKARRAGIEVKPPAKGTTTSVTRKKAQSDVRAGRTVAKKAVSSNRSKASAEVLKSAGRSATSKQALSKQGRAAAKKRSAASRSEAARKAARTKGAEGRSAAAKKAARTRKARH